jgi:hypothetical protein
MTARIYAHPTATGQDIQRLYREYSLVALGKPMAVGSRRRRVVELKPRAWPAWPPVQARL